MKRKVKTMLISCLSVASVACGALALGNVPSASADGTTPLIVLQDGASCRIKFDETEQASTGGIRFTADLDQTQWQALLTANSGAEFSAGVIVVPTDYVTEAGGYTHEKLLALATEYDLEIADCSYTSEEIGTETELAGSVINILDKNYTRDFSGIAYLKSSVEIEGWESYGGAWYTYANYDETKNVRNIYEVAYNAYNDRTVSETTVGETNYNQSVTFNGTTSYSPYSDAQREILKGYLDGVVDVKKDGYGDLCVMNNSKYYASPYTLTEVSADNWAVENGAGVKGIVYDGEWKFSSGELVKGPYDGVRQKSFNVTDGADTLTVLQTQGATFNNDGSVSLAVSNVNGVWASIIAQRNYNHIAFKGEYGIGTYIDFTFTGNNLPNVLLFADEINGNLTSDGGSGILLTNYGTAMDRFSVFGPTRIYTTGTNDGATTAYTDNTNRQFSFYDAQNSSGTRMVYPLLTQNGLAADDSGATYKYTVGTYLEGGYIVIDIQLYNVTENASVYSIQTTTKLTESDVTAGNIVVHGTIGENLGPTTFSYGMPYEKNFTSESATFNADGSVTLEAEQYEGNYTSHMTREFELVTSSADISYVAFAGEYGVGTYVTTSFVGLNMPNVMFFADQINGDLTDQGGAGLLLCGAVQSANLRGTSRLAIYGPNRIASVYDENSGLTQSGVSSKKFGYVYSDNDATLSLGKFTDTYLTRAGLLADTTGRTYTYTAGTYLDSNGYVVVHVIMTAPASGDLEAVNYDVTCTTTLKESDISAGSIVLYAGVQGKSYTTTFSYSEPYEYANDAQGATFNDDGSVTLEGKLFGYASWAHLVSANLNNNYVALEGEYGIGTYIDIEFTGNNLPNVLLFADEINGNMTSDGGKGIILRGGLYNSDSNIADPKGLYAHGPNRIPAYKEDGSNFAINDGSSYFGALSYSMGYPLLTYTGLSEDTSNRTYRYTVGTYLNADGYIVIDISLYDAITEEAIYEHALIVSKLTKFDVKSGSIVLYGTVKGKNNPTTFSYSMPYEGVVEDVELLSYTYGAPRGEFNTAEQYETYAATGLNTLFLTGENSYNYGKTETSWAESNAKAAVDNAQAAGIDKFILRDHKLIFQTRNLIGTSTDEVTYKFASVDELDEYVAAQLAQYINVEGFYGVGINDEPEYALAETVGQVYRSIKRVAKETYGKDIYVQLNLLPYETAGWKRFFSEELVGDSSDISTTGRDMADDYAAYLDAYFTSTGADVMTVDLYPYRVNNTFLATYYDGLRIFAEKCNEHGAEMGVVMQSFAMYSSTLGYREVVEEAEMLQQMNAVLGFGAKQYAFFSYARSHDDNETSDGVNYDWSDECSFLNPTTGETTNVYTWAKNAIAQATALNDVIVKYDYVGARLSEDDTLTKASNITNDKHELVVTELYREENGTYLYMLLNSVDPYQVTDATEEMTVSVTFAGCTRAAVFVNGAWSYVDLTEGVYSTTLAQGEAAYVIPLA